jgi:VanZ family protein
MSAVSRYAPPLLLMAAIFALSAQPDLNTGLGTWDTILRKLAHMAEFGLLWLLWWRALGYRSPWPAAAIAIGYAITDELHQTTVEGRVGSPVDVLIDTAGVALAIALATARRRRQPPPVPPPLKTDSDSDLPRGAPEPRRGTP